MPDSPGPVPHARSSHDRDAGSAPPDTAPGPGAPAPHPGVAELPLTFGKYFLTEKLATGGMAEIYLAKIVGPGGFEKQLVIKQIHPRFSGQRQFVDLFVAEAKTLVTLAHGNIVPVYELGVIDDTYFIAMEYIDGPTLYRLTEILRRRAVTMAPAIAAWITARILEGLDYAHRKGEGVIHRDLSPRNVMLSRDGEVKLVDFGIAVTLGAEGEDEAGESAPTGSFPYMSPEQVRKEPLTVQTDLFSVGVLLWEMLVGHRLFARSDPDATLHAVACGDIARPSAENPEVPARLDDAVMRALERDMTVRWATAGDMLAALQRYLYGLDEPPGPRDVAALVAKYCPPETRRLPTHHDELAEPAPDATQPRAAPTSPGAASEADEPPRPGPMTAVISRDRTPPRGKRSTRARTETFATHVALDEILERAPPVTAGADDTAAEPVPPDVTDERATRHGEPDAPPDDDRDDPTPLRLRVNRPSTPAPGAASPTGVDHRAARHAEPDDAEDADRDDPTPLRHRGSGPTATPAAGAPPIQLPGRMPPAGSLLVLGGIGGLALAAASVYVFYQGRGAVLRPDAAPRRDADLREPEVAPADDAAGLAIDAAVPTEDAAEAPAAATPPDARPAVPPRDAGLHRPRRDNREPVELPRPDAAVARPTGSATLTIGAIPWGSVLVDGKKVGRTPIDHLAVAAGHHLVEVVFGGEDPPRTLRYTVDLSDGDTRDVLADFTRP